MLEKDATSVPVLIVANVVKFMLMPSTRFGYLLYPAAFLLWAPALNAAPQNVDQRRRVPTSRPGYTMRDEHDLP